MVIEKNKLSVAELLNHAVQESPNKEVIYDLSRRLTYEELQQEVEQLSAGLGKLGIQKGDRVGVCLPNWNELAIIFFAAAKIGAIIVPFNPKYRSHEIEYILKNAEPKILFISSSFNENFGIDKARNLVDEIVSVRFEAEDARGYNELLVNDLDIKVPEIDVENDIFCFLYTSGTTGVPKGVMITHKSVVQSGNTIADTLRCTSEDVFIVPAPLFHIFGIACNLLAAISSQARMVLQEKYRPQDTLRLIEEEKVTIHQGVPAMFIMELEQPDFDKYDLSTLRTGMVGAAPCPPDKIKAIRERMGLNLCVSYGITETATLTATGYDDEEQKILDTVGKAVEGVELKIVDENREPLPPGEIGEIVVKSFGVMRGYYKLEEATREVLQDDWFYTGDLGSLDKEGYLTFVGRKKEMIIRGGYNIYPQEIEGILTRHPAILEAAVVGIPDETLGEIACAVLKLKDNSNMTEEDVINYLKEYVANYKLPSEVLFLNELPATASGKIQKVKLREQIINKKNKNSL